MGRTVPALSRALDILELFLRDQADLSAPEIVRALQLPRTTTHELLSTLTERGYLEPSPERPGRFCLGLRVHQLGSRYAEQVDLVADGQTVARAVADESGETAHLAVLEGTDVVYIAKADSTQAVRMVSAAGRRLPANCTAVGKMLLASLPEEELDSRTADLELPALTTHSITDVDALRAALREIQVRGYATEYRESNADVNCVAAPVRDISGEVVAALSLSVPVTRWSDEREAELAGLALRSAGRLSARLGCKDAE